MPYMNLRLESLGLLGAGVTEFYLAVASPKSLWGVPMFGEGAEIAYSRIWTTPPFYMPETSPEGHWPHDLEGCPLSVSLGRVFFRMNIALEIKIWSKGSARIGQAQQVIYSHEMRIVASGWSPSSMDLDGDARRLPLNIHPSWNDIWQQF